LDAGQPGVEVLGDVRERGVDHRDVEHEHRRGQRGHGEGALLHGVHGVLQRSRFIAR
jgi:hypothetical protein